MTTENKIKYFENREDWRKWLMDNFETSSEIWFVFPYKSSGKKSILYNDAVEEALCFDWIDSTTKPLDKDHKIQRFTPRNPKSTYSQANKERLKWLLANKMIHPEFEDKIRTVLSDPFIFPNDIMDRLKEDEIAWRNYRHFSSLNLFSKDFIKIIFYFNIFYPDLKNFFSFIYCFFRIIDNIKLLYFCF